MHYTRQKFRSALLMCGFLTLGSGFLCAQEISAKLDEIVWKKNESFIHYQEDGKIKSLVDVLNELEKKFKISFAYESEVIEYFVIDISRLDLSNKTLEENLKELPPTLVYDKVSNSVYAIYKKNSKNRKKKSRKITEALNSSIQSDELPRHGGFQNFVSDFQQDIKVHGTVTSETGDPMPGVNIIQKGTTIGTTTDVDGKYSLAILEEDAVLVFSFIGYVTQEVATNGKSVIDVALILDVKSLEEVVVVGYGTQKQVNVIGSVVTVSNEELANAPVSSITNALAGRLPGAIIQQETGEPGENAASILIRGKSTLGNNAPLIVIDGIPGRFLNTINPNDVESISILKDASAAIYGARAANGVILVTTKRGAKETPVTFNYNFFEGILTPTMLPKMADAPTYAQMIREMQSYMGVDESNMKFSPDDVAKYRSGEYPWTHPNTHWFEEALADYSTTRQHNFSVSGGTKSINYYGSFGTSFDDGIYKNSATSFKRYNLKANVDFKINEFLNLGFNTDASEGNGKSSSLSSGFTFDGAVKSLPTSPAYYPNGFPGPDIAYGQNPVVTASDKVGFWDDTRFRSNNILSATIKVPRVEGLSVSSYYAYDITFMRRKQFQKPWTLYQLDEPAYFAAGNTGKEDGSAFLRGSLKGTTEPWLENYYDNTKTNTFNIKVNFEKSIKDAHNLNAFVAYESSEYQGQGMTGYRRYFISDKLPYLFAGGDAEKDNSEWVEIDSRVNYFGRLSYDYKETYLFQFTLRRDGSLRFSKESGRWGNFPGLLAGWRVSNENFWKDHVKFIDFFKLKASWGQMGNDLVPPFQYLASYTFSTGAVLGENRVYSAGLQQSSTPNPQITWEVANVFNAGFESMFFNYKMTLNVDAFYQRRNNILVKKNASVPNFTGISLPDENFGIVDNKGFEIILGYNDEGPDFSYGINGNFAFAHNSVVEFDEPERNVPWQVQTGLPQGAALLYKSIGIFRNDDHVNSLPHVPGARPGDIIIQDYDEDGEITNDDRILFPKTVTPEITFGVSFNLKYKNWGLTGLVQGTGNTMRSMYYELQGLAGNYFQYDADGRWSPENMDASKPRAFERNEPYWRSGYLTDYYYQNAAYARMKNLQLSYTIPENIQNAIHVSEAQVYISGQNLFLIYSGNKIMDPELGGITNYPLMKVYSLGASISF